MRFCLLLLMVAWSAVFTPAQAQFPIKVSADLPGFFYAGDQPKLQFLLNNTDSQEKTGNLQLELFDAIKKQPVDGWFYNQLANQYFTLAPGERNAVRFPITIPNLFTGSIAWQLTIRIDTAQLMLRGTIDVQTTKQEEPTASDNVVGAKLGQHMLSLHTVKEKVQEKAIPPFATQPIGQAILIRVKLHLGKTHDSCRMVLPLSAGLEPTGRTLLTKQGKSMLRHRISTSDTAITTTFYGLTPGIYQFDYYFKARYPGQYLIPASRMFFSTVWSREMITTTSTLEID